MKRLLSLGIVLFVFHSVHAQIKNPVQWSFTAKKMNANTYEAHFTATIEHGWHVYSQTTPAGGPVPTNITFIKNPLLTVTGSPKEIGNLEQHHEELFGVDVKQFSNNVDFVQTIQVNGNAKTSLNGNVMFMVCNDKECLPPTSQKFAIPLQ